MTLYSLFVLADTLEMLYKRKKGVTSLNLRRDLALRRMRRGELAIKRLRSEQLGLMERPRGGLVEISIIWQHRGPRQKSQNSRGMAKFFLWVFLKKKKKEK